MSAAQYTAPELLAALVSVLPLIDDAIDEHDADEEVRAVVLGAKATIAKATGAKP